MYIVTDLSVLNIYVYVKALLQVMYGNTVRGWGQVTNTAQSKAE